MSARATVGDLLGKLLFQHVETADSRRRSARVGGSRAMRLEALETRNLLSVSGTGDDEPFGTGSLELGEADLVWKAENLAAASDVLLNELGLERVNSARAELGLAPLSEQEVAIAPLGEEVVDALLDQTAGGAGGELLDMAGVQGVLPSAVDNSTLQYFPGIRNQGSLGSCVPFSVTYYTLTHMTAMARGWDVTNPSDNTNKFSPKWTYNMVNDGVDGGANIVEVMSVLADHGAPTWAEMPYDSNFRQWVYNDASVWRDAIQYRPNDMGYVSNVGATVGLEQVKTLLANGYLLNYSTYINSWQYKTIGNDPSTTDDDYAVGKKAAYWVNGTNGGHVMTVVGYDDSIWVDINSNGTIDSGEKGAFRIANSWGTSWSPGGVNDGGFTWLAYDALKGVSAV
ncbi:MAG: C1 family peptidase, partial [Planctomycetaceae bacterium]|nr:C1 family peptidase [Planctomycetaceae bacterium]